MIRLAMLLSVVTATIAAAATPDPDWPCVQRRQPHLSIGQVWSGPPPDAPSIARAKTAEVQSVARVIALRRTSMDEATALITDFAAMRDPEALTALFVATFDHIQRQRDRVMGGITRYAHSQEALETRIEQRRHDFAALSAADPPDFDAIDKAEQDIDWSTRIFLDRQQSLTYVCETPVILEQRIFGLARVITSHLSK